MRFSKGKRRAMTLPVVAAPASSLLSEKDGDTRTRSLMPEKKTIERARADKRAGKSSSTQAGEFVREEIHHIREGKHGARSTKQAIAIGLSKARKAGVDLPPPEEGTVSSETRRSAQRAYRQGQSGARLEHSCSGVQASATLAVPRGRVQLERQRSPLIMPITV